MLNMSVHPQALLWPFITAHMVHVTYNDPALKRCRIKAPLGGERAGSPDDLSSNEPSSDLDISTFYSDLHHVHQFILREKRGNVLYGDSTTVQVYGEWDHKWYAPGMCMRIIECRCCSTEERETGSTMGDGSGHVSAEKGKKTFIITDSGSLLLLAETSTLSVTSIASGMACPLVPLLNERVEGLTFLFDDRRMVLGRLFHAMLQRERDIDELLGEHAFELFLANMTENEARRCILEELPKIMGFRRRVHGRNEEYIYSSLLQVKGVIDIVDNGIIEIKTGSASTRDIAQVLLYYLVSGIEPLFIYYLRNDLLSNVQIRHFDIVGVLNRRNVVGYVYFMWDRVGVAAPAHGVDKSSVEMRHIDEHGLSADGTEKDDILSVLDMQHFAVLKDLYRRVLCLCECRSGTACAAMKDILRMQGSRGQFLREMMEKMVVEEMHERRQHSMRVRCLFKKQTGNVLDVVPALCEHTGEYAENTVLDVYDGKTLVTTGETVHSDEGIRLRLSHGYNFRLADIHIEERRSHLLLRYMWYSLLFIAGGSHLLNEEMISRYNGCRDGMRTEHRDSSHECAEQTEDGPMQIPSAYRAEFEQLNSAQQHALRMCLAAREYCTIHGMPGSGKSRVVALLIKILLYHRRTVLLVCFTNLGLSNILERVSNRCYRAGSYKRDAVLSETANVFCNRGRRSVRDWRAYFDQPFVASTCFGLRDPVFRERVFDYLVVDEASQQHLLLSIIPISISRRFVLVGDPLQLHPLARTFRGVSLLEFLGTTCVLNRQYRMKQRIMRISNEMFYGSRMETGIDGAGCVEVIDIDRCAADTDSGRLPEFVSRIRGVHDKQIVPGELNVIHDILRKHCDDQTVVLCYFNVTVELVRGMDSRYRASTIDKYQGCEADSVILLIYPCLQNVIMESRERLNVALTRARNRLLIVCSTEKARRIAVLDQLLCTVCPDDNK